MQSHGVAGEAQRLLCAQNFDPFNLARRKRRARGKARDGDCVLLRTPERYGVQDASFLGEADIGGGIGFLIASAPIAAAAT